MNGRTLTKKLQPPTVVPLDDVGIPYGGNEFWVLWKLCSARPICFRLLMQVVRRAASRTDWTAGNSSPIKTPMMVITTSSSMRVNPRFLK